MLNYSAFKYIWLHQNKISMRKATLLGLGAAALAFIGTFLPVVSGHKETFWGSGEEWVEGYRNVMIFFMLAIGLFAFLANKKHLASIGTILSSIILFGLVFLIYLGAKAVSADVGTGIYMLFLSCLLGLISSILGFMKK